jgi:peptide chain release factor 2
LPGKAEQVAAWEKETEDQEFWNDPETAQAHMQKLSQLRDFIAPWDQLAQDVEDLQTLVELSVEEGDETQESEIQEGLEVARKTFDSLGIAAVLTGEHDAANAILSVNSGAGGTEACDWAEMLLRMYSMWAESRKYGFEVVDSVPGEGAGFRSATARVTGPNVYGYLKAEVGVHRLVRISPFDASKRRHTSFAAVDVVPEIDDSIEVDIKPEDLKVDTFRSSGAGGQHVNKTDSAVRITHLPSGTIVSCQNERSQHSNRRTAMTILRARLYELERQKREDEISALRGDQGKIEWGNQIRSYVLQPYTMVKDHRTNVEVGNVTRVLDGDIDEFIAAYLQASAGRGGE